MQLANSHQTKLTEALPSYLRSPYSNTYEHINGGRKGAHTFSKGIWKDVYLITVHSAAISYLAPRVYYKGEYPLSPLRDGEHSGFDVEATVHLLGGAVDAEGTVTVVGDWGGSASSPRITIPALSGSTSQAGINVTVKLEVPAHAVKLWWPVGVPYGGQHLYSVKASFSPSSSASSSSSSPSPVSTSREIGFRFFALVTGNDTAPGFVETAKAAKGTFSHGMYWRVNGAAIWSRGANVIPMDELEGRLDAEAHYRMVASSVEAGMNTLRVWGGGVFLPRAFYDACDRLGILVYHDMQYAQEGHAPKRTAMQAAELTHQVRRLSSHPSIVIWDGCNECQVVLNTSTGIYASFVMMEVAKEDASRAIWPSCPALGWTEGSVTACSCMPSR